jgi:hypothetical protein
MDSYCPCWGDTITAANPNTEAERLGEFVQHAIRVWIDTKNLDMPATEDYLRSITTQSGKLN